MAVAPLPQVQQVVEYALTEFHPNQLYLGIPNYGYDWTLPHRLEMVVDALVQPSGLIGGDFWSQGDNQRQAPRSQRGPASAQ